ncbi:MAG: hypothetical protein AAGK01_07230 [Pseudomonadota bacterium]
MANQSESEPLFFEVVDTVGKVSDANSLVLKPIAASHAFRKYNWLKMEPTLNKSNNLRGMVINKNARTVYKISNKAGKYLDKLAVLAIVVELTKESERIKQVWNSDLRQSERVGRSIMLGSAAILRSVTSVVPATVELAALSISGYGDLYSMITGSSTGNDVSKAVKDFAKEVRVIHNTQWDGENWYNIVDVTTDRIFDHIYK